MSDQKIDSHAPYKYGHTSYSHSVLQGGIAHPDCAQFIPFMPEEISNTDGFKKQDSEILRSRGATCVASL